MGFTKTPRTLAASLAGVVALALLTVTGGWVAAATATTGDEVSAASTVAKNANGKLKSVVKGKTSGGGTLGGSFTPLKFKDKNGVPVVKGVLEGKIAHADGSKSTFTAIRTLEVTKVAGHKLDAAVTAPGAVAACDILNLVLGPLDLNVLGLEVHLKQVVLDIVAVGGAGNLLGNLLCAVAGLLDGGPLAGLLGQLTTLLNQILAALGLGI